MNSVNRLFQSLNETETLSGQRLDLHKFLNAQLSLYKKTPSEGEKLAYEIAGLMSAQAIKNLPDDDPYAEIIALAGDLELPPAQRDKSSSWEKFESLLNNLPQNSN